MPNFEYKVVPAPKKGLKGKGIKTTEARFANALMTVMNELGAEGWEYQRSDALPLEERSGFRSRSTTVQNMLVFRRASAPAAGIDEPAPVAAQEASPASPTPVAEQVFAQSHAPLVNHTTSSHSTAPTLGPATEATEVVDPRLIDNR